MTVQIYCTTDDVEAVWESAVILRMADDDHSGELSETEQNYIYEQSSKAPIT